MEWELVATTQGRHTFGKGDSFVYNRPPEMDVEQGVDLDLRPNHEFSISMVRPDGNARSGIFTFKEQSQPESGRCMYVGGENSVKPCAVPTQ